ncbi:hypothetical protein GY21_10865 [Cryobacterium roopkundense]|uniref:RNA polymerase sigma-70 region 2 domain-containing protein n=1 Tax=Cryobacterium roopkundense TaxID=1001240 RepID=A0A099J559_9MICO|nr:hypothetical protein [Cryobacterium roopkundense]KGJ73534.1 hypothetical protein GY21_10865 [Cryobacterium roopkundense]MBB5641446.1 hypothetical protein [Cryobacterium roopkundense]
MTATEKEPSSPDDQVGGHLLLEKVAAGDALAFGSLYDAFVAETYAICLRNLANRAAADRGMAAVWTYIWSHAAALNQQPGSTRSIVLSTAWAITSQRSRSPLRRLTRRSTQTR